MAGRSLKIDDLRLDLDNPRITRADSQRDALQRIIDDQDVKLVALAESIVADGLNPMDRLLVIPSSEAGKFTVVEGNRRFAAIKLLSNKALLSDLDIRLPLKRRFEALSDQFAASLVEPIAVFEVSDRSTAAMWILQRHTGENEGRGIVAWNGVARARFRGRDPALQALDLVLAHGDLSQDEKDSIESRFPISTLDRLISTPDVRSQLGLEVQGDKLLTNLPAAELIRPLRRIVRDLVSQTINVTALKKKNQQVEYVRSLGTDLPDLTKASQTQRQVDELQDKEFLAAKPKVVREPKAVIRKTLIPKDLRLKVTNPKVAEIYKELRSLNIADYPHAVSVLLRVFLELSVDHYLTASGLGVTEHTPGGTKDKKLRKKVEESLEDMFAKGAPRYELSGISKAINDRSNPLNIDTLNNYVHNRFFSPTEGDLRVAWNNSQPFFERIWE